MDAGAVLDELTRVSQEVRHAVLLDAAGDVVAATAGADAPKLARVGTALLELATGEGAHPVDRVSVALPRGAVFVVRGPAHVAVATTVPEPPAALVVHDLRAGLARLAPAPKTRRGTRSAETRADA